MRCIQRALKLGELACSPDERCARPDPHADQSRPRRIASAAHYAFRRTQIGTSTANNEALRPMWFTLAIVTIGERSR